MAFQQQNREAQAVGVMQSSRVRAAVIGATVVAVGLVHHLCLSTIACLGNRNTIHRHLGNQA